MNIKYILVVALFAAIISSHANPVNAILIYDLRAASTSSLPNSFTISSDGKNVTAPANYIGNGIIALQLWGVIDDDGLDGFQNDKLIGGTLNVVTKNGGGIGAVSTTSGITGAAFPNSTLSGGHFNSAGSVLGLGGANARVRTNASPGVVADVPTLANSADGLDWGSDEDYVLLPPTNPIALNGYLLNGVGTSPQRSYSWALGSGTGIAAGTPIAGFSQAGTGTNAGKWEILLGMFTMTVTGTNGIGSSTTVKPFSYQRFRVTSTSSAPGVPGMSYSQGTKTYFGSDPIDEATQLSGIILVVIPEPSTYVLVSMLGIGAIVLRRRRVLNTCKGICPC